MTYNGKELAALVKLGVAMAQADGHVDQIEKVAIASELNDFGVNGEAAPAILAAAAVMDAAEAISILSSMTNEQKKYATGYLAAIMAADGEIADAEVKMWQLICTLASFPIMNIADALSFWTSHKAL